MDVHSKFRFIFELYFEFVKNQLTAAKWVSYSVNQSYCRFTVTFNKVEFAFVEKFYEYHKTLFKTLKLEDTWLDFMQAYDYDDKRSFCLFSLTLEKTLEKMEAR